MWTLYDIMHPSLPFMTLYIQAMPVFTLYDIMHPSYASSYPLWHYRSRLCQHLPFTSYIQPMPALTLYDIIHPNYASSDLYDIIHPDYSSSVPALTFVTFIHPSYGGSKPNHHCQIELARFIWNLMDSVDTKTVCTLYLDTLYTLDKTHFETVCSFN